MPWVIQGAPVGEWADQVGRSFSLRLLNGKGLLSYIDEKLLWGWGLSEGKAKQPSCFCPSFCPANAF